MPGALTVRTVPPEGSYWEKRRGRTVHVPKTHHAIICQGDDCEFSLHLPNHMLVELESRRIRHIKDLHYKELMLGEFTIHLETAWEEFNENVDRILDPFVGRGQHMRIR